MHAYSIKRQLRGMNSEKLRIAAATWDDDPRKLAKAEVERRKRKRERKAA